MSLLLAGIALFAGVHLIPSLAPALRSRLMQRLGEGGYKGIFSLLLVAAFALIISGWRSTIPAFLYQPAAGLHGLALAILILAFALMVVSSRNSRLRRIVRHPQLTGVTLWGLAHLLLNGDSRSVLLFGGMAVWAIIEIIAINRREGVWIKSPAPGWGAEVLTAVITVFVVAVVIFAHPWLAGVPVR
jgi:uncharacterized membrane protein